MAVATAAQKLECAHCGAPRFRHTPRCTYCKRELPRMDAPKTQPKPMFVAGYGPVIRRGIRR